MNRHPTRQAESKREVGRPGGPVSWSRRSGPHVAPLPIVSRSLDVPVSRLPQRRDRVPFRCGPGSTHHCLSRLRSAAEHPQGLALTGSGTPGVPAREAASFWKSSSRTCLQRVSCSFVSRTLDNFRAGMNGSSLCGVWVVEYTLDHPKPDRYQSLAGLTLRWLFPPERHADATVLLAFLSDRHLFVSCLQIFGDKGRG